MPTLDGAGARAPLVDELVLAPDEDPYAPETRRASLGRVPERVLTWGSPPLATDSRVAGSEIRQAMSGRAINRTCLAAGYLPMVW